MVCGGRIGNADAQTDRVIGLAQTGAAAMATMTMAPVAFDTEHEDLIVGRLRRRCSLWQHDAQLDYYGKRLATASSDRSVRIFQVEPNQPERLVCALAGYAHAECA